MGKQNSKTKLKQLEVQQEQIERENRNNHTCWIANGKHTSIFRLNTSGIHWEWLKWTPDSVHSLVRDENQFLIRQ